VSPVYVERRIQHCEAVALGLRDAAGYCRADQQALRERLLTGAQAIDEMASLLRSQTMVAKLNHDTIVARAEA
jgi:hypothetical protein